MVRYLVMDNCYFFLSLVVVGLLCLTCVIVFPLLFIIACVLDCRRVEGYGGNDKQYGKEGVSSDVSH